MCEACGEEIENITCDLKETVHWTNQAKCSGLTGGDSFEKVCVNVVFARLPVKLVNSFSLVVEAKLPLVYIKCVMLSCVHILINPFILQTEGGRYEDFIGQAC